MGVLADGGGKVTAARKPVMGAGNIVRFLAGIARTPVPDQRVEPSSFNGTPALIIYSGDRVDLVALVALVESSNEQVTGIYLVRNPDKLGATQEPPRVLKPSAEGLSPGVHWGRRFSFCRRQHRLGKTARGVKCGRSGRSVCSTC